LVLWSQSFLLSVCLALAICAYLEILPPLLLLTCTFLIGRGRALYYPGWQAMIFEFVSQTDAVPAIALNSRGLNIAR
ncbi:MFS transporter, partial [Rhizobium johnstonii]|uniref:MFS transporter n=1 Tax=Rhizobium johnstonii TaxID=3019933 RepID=UPI003F9E7C25